MRRAAAFTLIEVVVALGILVIALLGLASGVSSGMALDSLTRERSAACMAAMSKLDEAMGSSWAQLPSWDGATFDVTLEADGGIYPVVPGGGRERAGLVRVLPTTHEDCLRVSVSIVFRSRGTRTDSRVELDTLVARR